MKPLLTQAKSQLCAVHYYLLMLSGGRNTAPLNRPQGREVRGDFLLQKEENIPQLIQGLGFDFKASVTPHRSTLKDIKGKMAEFRLASILRAHKSTVTHMKLVTSPCGSVSLSSAACC